MSIYKHSYHCNLAQFENMLERAFWADKYPNHCRRCEGWGGQKSRYDPSAAGVSLSPGWMYDWDDCSKCTDQGVCPRCGYTWTDEDAMSDCRACNFELGETDGMPPIYEDCNCWDNSEFWPNPEELLDLLRRKSDGDIIDRID
jgi:hypothetical protein